MAILSRYLLVLIFLTFQSSVSISRFFAVAANPVKFYFYSSESPEKQVDSGNLEPLKIPGDGPLFVVIDGFLSSHKTQMAQTVKDGILRSRPNGKVVVVDWSELSGYNALNLEDNTHFGQFMMVYNKVKSNVEQVGHEIANFLKTLMLQNITEYSRTHLIGYSLGAHIAGITGNIIQNSNGRITRITGLDPAGPGFSMLNQRNRLDKSDAEFVDVYYTNRHIAGEIEHHVGHVDVYINGGRHQPGCLSHNIIHTTICNHGFSWKAWNKCVTTKCEGCPCCSLDCHNCGGSCVKAETIGINISLDLAGDYYVELGPIP